MGDRSLRADGAEMIPMLLAAGALLSMAISLPPVLDASLVLAFTSFGPGMSFAVGIDGLSLLERVIVAISASVAIAICTAEMMLILRLWHPRIALIMLVALTCILTAFGRRHRERREAGLEH